MSSWIESIHKYVSINTVTMLFGVCQLRLDSTIAIIVTKSKQDSGVFAGNKMHAYGVYFKIIFPLQTETVRRLFYHISFHQRAPPWREMNNRIGPMDKHVRNVAMCMLSQFFSIQ